MRHKILYMKSKTKVTVVVGRCDCGMKRAIRKLFDEKMVDKLANEMRKSVLRESETALKKLYWD